ncbi:hypothetical protein RHAL1_04016 [Beijerinckiaceae bacterium RH AL1]|nr:hypothetical protein RHAL1_04016 [Beijerinckiaceae bacterium RH AL1]
MPKRPDPYLTDDENPELTPEQIRAMRPAREVLPAKLHESLVRSHDARRATTRGTTMKEPGLDGRHRDLDGRIQQKRSDTLNKNLSHPIPGFSPRRLLARCARRRARRAKARSGRQPKRSGKRVEVHAAHGSTTAIPASSKCLTLRVASMARFTRTMPAIIASLASVGRPATRRLAMSAAVSSASDSPKARMRPASSMRTTSPKDCVRMFFRRPAARLRTQSQPVGDERCDGDG